jgi:type IV secretion system protein VirB6
LFSAWIAQLANYALITILTVMVAALLLQVVQSFASQTAAKGPTIMTVDALNMVLIAVLVFLILRQVMPLAAGLAGGLALNSSGLLSGVVRWSATRVATRATGPKSESGTPYSARGFGGAPGQMVASVGAAARPGQSVDRRA